MFASSWLIYSNPNLIPKHFIDIQYRKATYCGLECPGSSLMQARFSLRPNSPEAQPASSKMRR